MRIICSEAFLLGLSGGVAGAAIGAILPGNLAPFVVHTQHVHIGLDPAAIGITVVLTSLIAIAASVYPALRAARIDPVESLREL